MSTVITRLLDRRAEAIRAGDRAAYESVLGPDAGFRTAQNAFFDNMQQLPLSEFAYALEPDSLVRRGDRYSVVVRITTALQGFDAAPVASYDRFRFTRVGGKYRLVSVTDREWEAENAILPQPWELVPIEARTDGGVLALFDAGTVSSARTLVGALRRSIEDIRYLVPYPEWSGMAVVYALTGTEFSSRLEGVPGGGDAADLDALTFSLTAADDPETVAASRIVLNPPAQRGPADERDRLLRHELTHVAIGPHDDRAPVWLAEGIAEYVSVQSQAEEDRGVAPAALRRAEQKAYDSLPDAEGFYAEGAALNYAIAWWVCEYISATYGEPMLWTLLDRFDRPDASQAAVLEQLLQISERKLVRKAARLMVRTYAPEQRPDGAEPSPAEASSTTGAPEAQSDR